MLLVTDASHTCPVRVVMPVRQEWSYLFIVLPNLSMQIFLNLCLKLMGLAMYNGINLDIMLPFIAYKKLLSPAVVPCGNPNATVGVISSPTIKDLESVMPVSVIIKTNVHVYTTILESHHQDLLDLEHI